MLFADPRHFTTGAERRQSGAPIPLHTSLVAGSASTTLGTLAIGTGIAASLGELAVYQESNPAEAVVTFKVLVDLPIATGIREISSQGAVSGAGLAEVLTDDPEVGGSADPTKTPISTCPVLQVEKQATLFADANQDGLASPGDELLYRIEIRSTGNTGATALRLTDLLPEFTELVAGSLQSSQGTVVTESPIEIALGSLEPAATATLTFRVAIAASFPADRQEVANQASVASAELPPVLSDDPETSLPGDPTTTPVPRAIEISIADVTVTEGEDAIFRVTLSNASGERVTADYVTVADSALEVSDFLAASGTLTFEIGETEKTIVVKVIDDLLYESAEERFFVDLSAATVAIADPRGIGTILDNEPCLGPNLLVNAGAEAALVAGNIPGWLEVLGTNWLPKSGSPSALQGAASFFPGAVPADGFAELGQSVVVASYQVPIEAAEGQQFVFSGALRTAEELPSDVGRIVVEYRDATGTLVLDAFDTGEIASPLAWQRVEDVRRAPAGTRIIQVRLLARRLSGSEANVYFDDLSLVSLRKAVLTLGDATVYEGDSGYRNASFPVLLSCPLPEALTMTVATADLSATQPADYSGIAHHRNLDRGSG